MSSTIRHANISHELPTELPKDLKEKFEVKDVEYHQSISQAQSEASVGHARWVTKIKAVNKKVKKNNEPSKISSKVGSRFVYPTRRPASEPFSPGEQLLYSISYLGVAAGDFSLEVLPLKIISNRKAYHIRGIAVSSPVFSLFYRLNDIVESFMDYDGEFSHRFHILLDESKQKRDSLELNDSEKAQTYYWNRWDHKANGYSETKEYATIQPFSQDSLSALYYVRTIPLPDGAVITFPVVSEGKNWEAVCNVVRREEVDSPWGKVKAVVIRPEMKYQGLLKKSGDSYLWLTDDYRRIPLRLEAKVRIGSVVANLKKVEFGRSPAEVVPLQSPSPSSVEQKTGL